MNDEVRGVRRGEYIYNKLIQVLQLAEHNTEVTELFVSWMALNDYSKP